MSENYFMEERVQFRYHNNQTRKNIEEVGQFEFKIDVIYSSLFLD